MKCLSKVALSSRRLFRLSELSIRMTYAHRSRVSILPAYVARFTVICATIRGPVCRKNILIAFKTFDEYIFHVDFFLLYLFFLVSSNKKIGHRNFLQTTSNSKNKYELKTTRLDVKTCWKLPATTKNLTKTRCEIPKNQQNIRNSEVTWFWPKKLLQIILIHEKIPLIRHEIPKNKRNTCCKENVAS